MGLYVKLKGAYEIAVATVTFVLAPDFSLGFFRKFSLSEPLFSMSSTIYLIYIFAINDCHCVVLRSVHMSLVWYINR